MNCQAVPPEQATPGAYCTCCGKPARVPDEDWIEKASTECYRGFVRDSRFGGGQVIKGTDRSKSRAFRRGGK